MAWRTLLVQGEGRLNVRNSQLILWGSEGEATVAIEELSVVILDTQAVTITSALLQRLCEGGATALICDEKHMPSGLLVPFHQHTRLSETAFDQSEWSLPFKKRVWQAVVRRKVENQAKCLDLLDIDGGDLLRKTALKTASGDTGHVEARCAQIYWKLLFGGGFTRTGHREPDPDRLNGALNYGYAVVRSAVARSLTAHGLLPCFGVHHKSKLNSFNLADDFIEPLRPLVDLAVYRLAEGWAKEEGQELRREDRTALAALLGKQVSMEGEMHSILRSSDLMAQSLIRAGSAGDAGLLCLPRLAERCGDEQGRG